MLNRIYIIAGVLIILAIGAAFVVPRFIQWSDYRDRMEQIAQGILGTEVRIRGDVSFSLLPAPQLRFSDVSVGPPDAPVLTIDAVDADFSLLDFLRDRYTLTRLVLNRPALTLSVDADGRMVTPIRPAGGIAQTNVAINNATLVDGAVRLLDTRSGDTLAVDDIDGDLRLTSVRGPFSFQGDAAHEGADYLVRFNTTATADDGTTRFAFVLRPADEGYSLQSEGVIAAGDTARFTGKLTYRQRPPRAESAGTVQGDLLLESTIEADADQVLLSAYTLTPDENRPAARFTGAAVVRLGAAPEFDAVVNGGVFALPPRDATTEAAIAPYELVRLLGELPEVPVPPMPGKLALEVSEFNLRGVALRTVKLDATSDGEAWTIGDLSARLPGDTVLKLAGTVGTADHRPTFDGTVALTTQRLDALAILWRRGREDNPLFNMPASLTINAALSGDMLELTDGQLTLDGVDHAVSASLGFGPERELAFTADLGTVTAADAAALAALVPETGGNSRFLVTFPNGRFRIGAAEAVIDGLAATGLLAEGRWQGPVVHFDALSAEDFGGAAFELSATTGANSDGWRLAGKGSLRVDSASAPAVTRALDMVDAPAGVRAALGRWFPADVAVELSLPNEQGGQVLALSGSVGSSEVSIDAQMAGGLLGALGGQLAVTANLSNGDAGPLLAQIGLPEVDLLAGAGAKRLSAVLRGDAPSGFSLGLALEGGGDRVSFDGRIGLADIGKPSAEGAFTLSLADSSGLGDVLGAQGIHTAPVAVAGDLALAGNGTVTLAGIEGSAGPAALSGNLTMTRDGTVSGAIAIDSFDAGALAAVLLGPAALVYGVDPYWPDGPIDAGIDGRSTRGEISVTAPAITLAGRAAITDARFTLAWDRTTARIRALNGEMGGGTIAIDVSVCCAGVAAAPQLSGLVSLGGAALDQLLPPSAAAVLDGTARLSGKFSASGATLSEMVHALTGDGTFSVDALVVEGLDAGAFALVAARPDLLDIDPDSLAGIARLALEQQPFAAERLEGSFTIAAGTIRATNLAAENESGRLFGNLNLGIDDLGLAGSFRFSPIGFVDPAGLITESEAQVLAQLSGSLVAPERIFDVGVMVDAVKLKALDAELQRLVKLQEEDEARRRAAVEERQRLMDEQARIEAEAEAARIAEEQRLAAEAEAARVAEEQRLAAEAEAARVAEEQRLAAEAEAARIAEEERLAAEAEAARQAEEIRLAEEAEAAQLAEEQRLAAEAEAARLAAEAREAANARSLDLAREAEALRWLYEQVLAAPPPATVPTEASTFVPVSPAPPPVRSPEPTPVPVFQSPSTSTLPPLELDRTPSFTPAPALIPPADVGSGLTGTRGQF